MYGETTWHDHNTPIDHASLGLGHNGAPHPVAPVTPIGASSLRAPTFETSPQPRDPNPASFGHVEGIGSGAEVGVVGKNIYGSAGPMHPTSGLAKMTGGQLTTESDRESFNAARGDVGMGPKVWGGGPADQFTADKAPVGAAAGGRRGPIPTVPMTPETSSSVSRY